MDKMPCPCTKWRCHQLLELVLWAMSNVWKTEQCNELAFLHCTAHNIISGSSTEESEVSRQVRSAPVSIFYGEAWWSWNWFYRDEDESQHIILHRSLRGCVRHWNLLEIIFIDPTVKQKFEGLSVLWNRWIGISESFFRNYHCISSLCVIVVLGKDYLNIIDPHYLDIQNT